MRIILKTVVLLSSLSIAFPAIAVEQFDSEQSAQQHCPSDTVIWMNLRSKSVHAKGQRWYGKTHVGAYICRKEVVIR